MVTITNTSVSIANTTTTLLAASSASNCIIISNDSQVADSAVYLALGASAVVNKGIRRAEAGEGANSRFVINREMLKFGGSPVINAVGTTTSTVTITYF